MQKKKEKKPKTWELSRRGQKWTQAEEDLLRELYPQKFNFELVKVFKRPIGGIYGKANHMGIIKNWRKYTGSRLQNHKNWSKKEIKRLERLFPKLPIAQLRKHFPKRSDAAICKKALLLGLRKDYIDTVGAPPKSYLNLWREQKELLIQLYPTTSNQELAKLFGRSRFAIKTTALKLGLHKAAYVQGERNGRGIKLWTQAEDALIRKLYPTTQAKDIAARLEERDAKSIQSRASLLGVKKNPAYKKPNNLWPDEDIERLRQLWQQGYSQAQIAETISRSLTSVIHQVKRQKKHFGLPKRTDEWRSWSDKETAYLIRHYKSKTLRELSAILGRKISSILGKAKNLNLTEGTPKTKWTADEINIVKKYYNQWSPAKIATKIGRTPGAIKQKAIALNLSDSVPRWTAEEIGILKKYYKILSTGKIAQKLTGRTLDSIRQKGIELGLRKR